jgi:phosphoglycolate phosphatase
VAADPHRDEWSMEKILAEVKLSMRDSFPTLFGDRWKEAGDFYTQSYRSINLAQLTPLLGAEDTLKAIPRDRVFTGVVSNKQSITLRQEVPQLGWDKYFNVWIGAGDAAKDKPFADPALLALKDSGIAAAANVWFVGDTGADLGCAKNAGFTAILYHEKPINGNTFDGYPFAAHVRNQAELKALISSAL